MNFITFSFQVAYRQWLCATMVGTTNDIVSGNSDLTRGGDSSPLSNSADSDVTNDDVTNDVMERSETKSSMPFSSARKTRAALAGSVRQGKAGTTGDQDSDAAGANSRSATSPNEKLVEGKPCYHLCRNVELSCPFLNPSMASGGRPVFQCPTLIGWFNLFICNLSLRPLNHSKMMTKVVGSEFFEYESLEERHTLGKQKLKHQHKNQTNI